MIVSHILGFRPEEMELFLKWIKSGFCILHQYTFVSWSRSVMIQFNVQWQVSSNKNLSPANLTSDLLAFKLTSYHVWRSGCVHKMNDSCQWADHHQSVESGQARVLWEYSSVSPVTTKDCSRGKWEMLFYNESPRQRHTETCLLKKSVIIYSPSNAAVGEAY